MFSKILNTAVLDLTLIPCDSNSNHCTRTLQYQCGDDAVGFGQTVKVKVQGQILTLAPKKMAIIGDMGVPHGLKTIAGIEKRVASGDVQVCLYECYLS